MKNSPKLNFMLNITYICSIWQLFFRDKSKARKLSGLGWTPFEVTDETGRDIGEGSEGAI
jgi:hypothetical protein